MKRHSHALSLTHSGEGSNALGFCNVNNGDMPYFAVSV